MLRILLLGLLLSASHSAWSASDPIRVACIGDSITEGSGLGLRTYPAKLGGLLGDGYEVRNYGLGGRTLLKKGDYPYWNESYYQQSRAWEPDIVVIMLGTNDSKSQNWQFGDEFVGDYEEMIATYQSLTSQPRILVATPPPVFKSGAAGISPTIVANEIAPDVRDIVTRLGLEMIDYHERMADLSTLFPDTVHPSAGGTTVMAALAFEVITNGSLNPPVPTLVVRYSSTGSVFLEWPVDSAAYVMQERVDLTYARTPWAVTGAVTVNDGNVLRIELPANRPRFYYQLWKP